MCHPAKREQREHINFIKFLNHFYYYLSICNVNSRPCIKEKIYDYVNVSNLILLKAHRVQTIQL